MFSFSSVQIGKLVKCSIIKRKYAIKVVFTHSSFFPQLNSNILLFFVQMWDGLVCNNECECNLVERKNVFFFMCEKLTNNHRFQIIICNILNTKFASSLKDFMNMNPETWPSKIFFCTAYNLNILASHLRPV